MAGGLLPPHPSAGAPPEGPGPQCPLQRQRWVSSLAWPSRMPAAGPWTRPVTAPQGWLPRHSPGPGAGAGSCSAPNIQTGLLASTQLGPAAPEVLPFFLHVLGSGRQPQALFVGAWRGRGGEGWPWGQKAGERALQVRSAGAFQGRDGTQGPRGSSSRGPQAAPTRAPSRPERPREAVRCLGRGRLARHSSAKVSGRGHGRAGGRSLWGTPRPVTGRKHAQPRAAVQGPAWSLGAHGQLTRELGSHHWPRAAGV